jgi:type II secretory pathway predicted ATPase ExeA
MIMDNQKLQALYGLKWNPFSPEVPDEALMMTPKTGSFCHRVETLVIDGGFAMITGDPGTGKSVTLRLLASRLSALRDLEVGVISRPQSGISDFYREISMIFGFNPIVNNRWGNYRALRDKWLSHIETTMLRPVLLIDEAQEMHSAVLNELRLLSSVAFDSKSILTVVLCGDHRLIDRFRSPELAPLGSRIRTRYHAEPATRDEMRKTMYERIASAGNPILITDELIDTLVDHSAGNYRALFHSADEVLALGIEREAKQIGINLFFDLYQVKESTRKTITPSKRVKS